MAHVMNLNIARCFCIGLVVLAKGAFASAQPCPPTEEVAKLTASDAAADDRFGVSVSVSGDTAVVGA